MTPGDLNIALILKLVDQATGPAKAVINTVQQVGTSLDEVGGKGVKWANEQIAANNARRDALKGEALEVLALGGTLLALTEPAIQAERRLAEVSKFVDFEAPDGLKVLQRDIRELVTSGGLVVTAEGVTDIVTAAGKLGVIDENLPDARKRAELLEFATAASKMAIAFDISAGEAGTTLARWRQNLDLSQDGAMALADTVNFLGNTMATSEADIVSVINRQGVVAKTAGLAENEIAALSATILAAGASPEIAATGMKNFTNALVKGESLTKRQGAVMQALGIDGLELAKRMQVDAVGGILSVVKALEEVEPYRRNSMIGDLFGEEAKGAITPLIENADMLRETFAKTADTSQLLGLMEEEYQRQAATTFAQRQRLFEYVKGLSVAVGTILLPQLLDLMETIMPIVAGMTAWAEAHPELIQFLVKLLAGVFALKLASVGLRFAFFALAGPMLQIFKVAMLILRGFGMLAAANPITLIILAIAAAAYVVYDNWDALVGWFLEKVEAVRAAFDEGLLNGVLKLLAEFNPFTLAWEGSKILIEYLMELVGVPDQVRASFAEFSLYDSGVAMIQSLWDGAASLIQQMVDALKAKLNGILPDWMTDHGNATAERIATLSPGGNTGVVAGPGALYAGRDSGGPVRAGVPYIVGERGREYFVPGVDGSILPTRSLNAALSNENIADRFDRRPPLSGFSQAQAVARQGDKVEIHIHPAPGANAQEIAREVANQLNRRDAQQSANLHDGGDY